MWYCCVGKKKRNILLKSDSCLWVYLDALFCVDTFFPFSCCNPSLPSWWMFPPIPAPLDWYGWISQKKKIEKEQTLVHSIVPITTPNFLFLNVRDVDEKRKKENLYGINMSRCRRSVFFFVIEKKSSSGSEPYDPDAFRHIFSDRPYQFLFWIESTRCRTQ